jgi:CrcB protein
MKFHGLPAVGASAAAGAWLRWWFVMALNPMFPTIPLGTLGILIVRSLFSAEAP